MIHYARAVDHIKKRLFEVEVPAFYHPNMPANIVNPPPRVREKLVPGKIRKTGLNGIIALPPTVDPHQLQRASYSIETMLDMFNRKIEFALIQTFDIVEVLESLDRYLLSIKHDVEAGNQQITDYAKLVVRWRGEVYKHYYRYMKLNPAALARLHANNDPNKNFFSLMSAITGNDENVKRMDPLRAMAYPPYPVGTETANAKTETPEVIMETSFGLPNSAVNKLLSGDGDKFDFDDFLNRR